MPATLAIVLVVFLVLFFLAICFALYVWWKKSIYTRERFAFAGLAVLSSLALFVLTSVLCAANSLDGCYELNHALLVRLAA